MKILILEAQHLQRALRRLGHDVLSIGRHERGSSHDVILEQPLFHAGLVRLLAERSFRPDLVLWCDAGYTPRVFGFEALPAVTIGFFVDTYCNPWHVPYAASFDLALAAQKNAAALMDAHGVRARWFPLFCNHERDRDPGLERDVPVSFVGTIGHGQNSVRRIFLDAFRRRHPLFATSGDYAPVFNRSRIVLNQSAAGEINYRQFEAAACGAAVLAEDTDQGLHDLFTPGVDILPTYPRGDAAAAARIARAALADPEGLARIARAGRDAVHARHTDLARAEELVRLARELAAEGAPARRLARGEAARAALARTCAFIVADAGVLPPDHVRLYQALIRDYPARWQAIGERGRS
ncbi:MAG: glycosyltransferase family 1 protein [Desulfovibrionaceae bacterium]|nr:glycosyltransferase family 1 protein [Desulfovibrionaceae bacterium]